MKTPAIVLSIFVLLLVLAYLTLIVPYFYIVDGHIALFCVAGYFLFRKNLGNTLKSIGFPGNAKTTAIYIVGGFAAIIIASILINLMVHYVPQLNDLDKVVGKVEGLPIYLIIFAVLFAPFSEELFFRAFLAGRFGPWISALAFGIVHVAYGSISEVIGAFVLGLIFAFIYIRSKSITPCILLHMLYNAFAIWAMGVLG